MPIALVRSISLPNLKIYTTISLLLVSGCFYYAYDVVRTDPQWKLHQNASHNYAMTRPSLLKQTSNDAVSVLTNNEILSTSTLTSPPGSINDDKSDINQEKVNQESVFDESNQNGTNTFVNQLKDVAQYMTHEPFCIWVSIIIFSDFSTVGVKVNA